MVTGPKNIPEALQEEVSQWLKGNSKPKQGIHFQLSADGKSGATVVNAKGVTSGTFSCGCGNNSSSGACSVVIEPLKSNSREIVVVSSSPSLPV